jgi:hypothetical protein
MSLKSRVVNVFDYARSMFDSVMLKIKFSRTSSSSSFIVGSSPEAYLMPIYTRIAVDVASQKFSHALVDQNNTVLASLPSTFSFCLSDEPNFDQTAFPFFQNLVLRLMQNGIVVVVPVEFDLADDGTFKKVTALRLANLVQENVDTVVLDLYNDETGLTEHITLGKNMVAIIESPLRDVMGKNNATLKRLLDKINMLDTSDRKNNSGKLDMIIQLPYAIKTDTRKELVDKRMLELEEQLSKSDLGIAYTEATEKVVQLNRTIGGNLMGEIAELTTRLHNQLGITETFMIGAASMDEIRNYYSRTINPITRAINEALTRTFIPKKDRLYTDSGRTDIQQWTREKVVAERDLFELVSPMELMGFADGLTRNEIASPTELRTRLGLRPTGNPDSDVVRNRNMPVQDLAPTDTTGADATNPPATEVQK